MATRMGACSGGNHGDDHGKEREKGAAANEVRHGFSCERFYSAPDAAEVCGA